MQNQNQELVDRLRLKDKGAFELVFNQYYAPLKSYAMRFLDDPQDAEEIVQDVFIKFWEKCDHLAEGSSLKNYLYRSVHNSCLNFIKHEKVKSNYRDYVIQYMESSSELEFEDEIPDVTAKIQAAIEKLPPRCKEIFTMSRYEGLKYQEIADHLDISIKTVEVQMGKALRSLREELKDLIR